MNTCTICKNCGTELPTQARFCGTCGMALYSQAPLSEQHPLQPPNQGYSQSNPVSLVLGKSTVSYVVQPRAAASQPLQPDQPGHGHAPSMAPSQPVSSSRPLPGYAPPPPVFEDEDGVSRPDRKGALFWGLLGITIIVITALSAGGLLAYIMTRPHPQPQISLVSAYTANGLPAGTSGTSVRMQGQKFSSASAMTLLLDGHSMPGAPRVVSDQEGNFSILLPVTTAWSSGRHVLTARDANHYTPKEGAAFEVVMQGEVNTPGPNGAPSDDANFTLNVTIQGEDTSTQAQDRLNGVNGPLSSADPLIVTGNTTSAGGSVCKERDDGQEQTYQGTTSTGLPYTQVATFSCTGTYKGGQLAYTETLVSDVVTIGGQGASYTCHLLTSGVDEQLNGGYTAAGFSGSMVFSSFPQSDFACTTGELPYFYFSLLGGTHNWTATTASTT